MTPIIETIPLVDPHDLVKKLPPVTGRLWGRFRSGRNVDLPNWISAN